MLLSIGSVGKDKLEDDSMVTVGCISTGLGIVDAQLIPLSLEARGRGQLSLT